MEEFNIQVKQTSFYKYCLGTFGYVLVFNRNAQRWQWNWRQNTKPLYITNKNIYNTIR